MTTGLDPQARRDAWELIEGVRDRGVTIVLVTHFMEEAERLCDRVALIDHGRIVALDTPANLTVRAQGGKSVRFLPSAPFDDRLLTVLPEVTRVEHEGQHVIVTGTGELVNAVILALHAAGVEARDVQLDASNLEDAFVRLTGKHLHQRGRTTVMSALSLPLARPTRRAAFGQIVRNEARLAWRRPQALIVGSGSPWGCCCHLRRDTRVPADLRETSAGCPRSTSTSRSSSRSRPRLHRLLPTCPARSSPTASWASCAVCQRPRYPPPGCWPRRPSSRRAWR